MVTMRISLPKLALLMAMSVFGLWASAEVLIVYQTLREGLPFCTVQEVTQGPGIALNCYAVLSSRYSQIFGVPLELFAVGYFLVNLILLFFIAVGSDYLAGICLKTLFGWRFIGVIIVPYLVFVELVLVRAICIYCTIMHVAIIVDFVIISYLLFYKKIKIAQ